MKKKTKSKAAKIERVTKIMCSILGKKSIKPV